MLADKNLSSIRSYQLALITLLIFTLGQGPEQLCPPSVFHLYFKSVVD